MVKDKQTPKGRGGGGWGRGGGGRGGRGGGRGEGGAGGVGSSTTAMEFNELDWDIRKIRKEMDYLGSPYMTWKERKDLENKKIVSLGGKPPKRQRLPLSIARKVMKNQKKREEKLLRENPMVECVGGKLGRSGKQSMERRKPEDMVLRSSEGSFRNGVLDVKRLLHDPAPPSRAEADNMIPLGKKRGGKNDRGKKKGGNKDRGKKKGGGKKKHH
ncbi:hypothetical protein Dimus_021482 [Dionaea muscipula]